MEALVKNAALLALCSGLAAFLLAVVVDRVDADELIKALLAAWVVLWVVAGALAVILLFAKIGGTA